LERRRREEKRDTHISFFEGPVRSDYETERKLRLVEERVGCWDGVEGGSHVGVVGYGVWTLSNGCLIDRTIKKFDQR